MRFKRKILSLLPLIVFVVLFFSLIGCELPPEIDLREIEDITGYFKLILENEEFFKSEEAILNDAQFGKINQGSESIDGLPSFPHQIQRVVKSRDITTEFISDTIAIVTLLRAIEGELFIDMDESSGEQQTISKKFTEDATRKAKFLKVANTGIPEYDWKLVELSLLRGSGEDRFNITSLKITLDERSSSEVEDPLNTFFRIGKGVPTVPTVNMEHFIENGVAIFMILKSSYEEAEHVFLRHGGGALGQTAGYRVRTPLKLLEEEKLDDRLFQRSYYIEWEPLLPLLPPNSNLRKGRFSAIVEVLSSETLSDANTQVESEYWGVPFVVD